MVQVINQGNNTVGAIPLYQKGFNWLKFCLGFFFSICLCILLIAAITFLTLYIIAQAGAIGRGRMIGTPISAVVDTKPALNVLEANQINDMNILNKEDNVIKNTRNNFKYKYERLKSSYLNSAA